MSDVDTGAKTLETITLVHPKDENELLRVELRAEEGGHSVLVNRGPRDGELKKDNGSDSPIPLDRARIFFDRAVEEAIEQGFEPEYDDDLDDFDLESLAAEASGGGGDKASSLSGLAALAAALGEIEGADPKAMLERIAPSDNADEEAGAAPVEFIPDESSDGEPGDDLPADARVSLDDAAGMAAPDGDDLAAGIDPAQLLGALLGEKGGGAEIAAVKRPKRAPLGATPEELCDLALARAVERMINADQVELDPRAFESLLEELLKVVVAADSPQAAMENACETLMDSDHVEEIYGEDAEIIAELRQAFEEVRAEAQSPG